MVLMNHHNQPHRRDHQRRPGPQRGMDAFQVQSMQGMPPMYMSMVPPGLALPAAPNTFLAQATAQA